VIEPVRLVLIRETERQRDTQREKNRRRAHRIPDRGEERETTPSPREEAVLDLTFNTTMASGILGNKKMRPATTGLIRSGSFLLVLLCSWGAAEATNYTVGGSSRWALGVNYDTWASSQTFYVGDNLG
jgi:hypothetical protein